jgi:hypothetical protein
MISNYDNRGSDFIPPITVEQALEWFDEVDK